MILHLFLVSFVTSTLVRLEGWELQALEDLVAIMRDVVGVHDESRAFFNHHFMRAGIVTSGKLTGFNLYHELFASTLNPNFPVDSLEHSATIIGVVHEAVGEAADDFDNIFQTLMRFPSSNASALVEVHESFSGRWAYLHQNLADLRSRCGISSKSMMPRTEPRGQDIDSVTMKYFVDLMALFTSMRELVNETSVLLSNFFEWFTTQPDKDQSDALYSTLAVTLEEFKGVRVMKMHEKLEPLVQDATEFATFSKLLGDRISTIYQQVGSFNSSDPTVVDFYTNLKNNFIKRWKKLVVASAVLGSRISTEFERRTTTTTPAPRLQRRKVPPTPPPVSTPIDDEERENMMTSLIRFAEQSERLPRSKDRSPKDDLHAAAQEDQQIDFRQGLVEMIEIMEQVVELHEECGNFLIDAYASAGFSGQNKFAGIAQYRKIFGAVVVSEPVLRDNQTQIAIAVAHESVGDVVAYVQELLVEIENLGFQPDDSPDQPRRQWIAEWKSLHDKLFQLRLKYKVPAVRFLPAPRGVYTSDKETVKFLGQVMRLFSQMRNLLTGSFSDLFLFQGWIEKNRKYFSQVVRPPNDALLEANVTAILEDFQKIETIQIHESLPALSDNASELEIWAERFASHILRLVHLISSLGMKNDKNAVADLLKALRQFHYPKWNECYMSIVTVRQAIEQALISRKIHDGGSVSDQTLQQAVVPEIFSAERARVLQKLLDLAAQDDPAVGKRGGNKKKSGHRAEKNVRFDLSDKSSNMIHVPVPDESVSDQVEQAVGGFQEVVGSKERKARRLTTTTTQAPKKTTTTLAPTQTSTTTQAPTEKSTTTQAPTEKTTVSKSSVWKSVETTTVVRTEKNAWSTSVKPSVVAVSTEVTTAPVSVVSHQPESITSTQPRQTGPVLPKQARSGRRRSGVADPVSVQQRYDHVQPVNVPMPPPVFVDVHVDACMRRVMELTENLKRTFTEMAQLCYNMEPRLWSSGNIEGALSVMSTRQMAQNALGNTNILEQTAHTAWRSQFTPRTPRLPRP